MQRKNPNNRTSGMNNNPYGRNDQDWDRQRSNEDWNRSQSSYNNYDRDDQYQNEGSYGGSRYGNQQTDGYQGRDYNSYPSEGRSVYSSRSENDDRNIFQRGKDRIKNRLNNFTDRTDDRYYGRRNETDSYGRDYGRDRYDDDRNVFERAGSKIRQKWNDLTDRDDDRDHRGSWDSDFDSDDYYYRSDKYSSPYGDYNQSSDYGRRAGRGYRDSMGNSGYEQRNRQRNNQEDLAW
jgi:hypothetical protein